MRRTFNITNEVVVVNTSAGTPRLHIRQRTAMSQLTYFRDAQSQACEHALVGGKARNLWLLGRLVDCPVPSWFSVTTDAFGAFIKVFCVELCGLRSRLATHVA